MNIINTNKTMYSHIYKHGVIFSGVVGSAYGLVSGVKEGYNNFYSGKKLNKTECIMEYVCFSTVVVGYTFLWTIIGVATFHSLPVTIPYSVYKKMTDSKDIGVDKLVNDINKYCPDDSSARI